MAELIVAPGPQHLTANQKEVVDRFSYDPITGRIVSDKPIQTTLNSLFLGEHHKVSSGGENVFFTNLLSDIAYYPMWGGIKDQKVLANQGPDGIVKPSARIYSDDMDSFPINGAAATVGSVPYATTFVPPENESLYGITVELTMALTAGDYLEYRIYDGVNNLGDLVYETEGPMINTYASGDLLTAFGGSPNETKKGSSRFAELMIRPGGVDGVSTPVTVRPASSNAGVPWVELHTRIFKDVNLDLNVVKSSDGSTPLILREPTKFLVDSSVNATSISFVSSTTLDIFEVRDSTENMDGNPCVIHFRNDGDTADLFTVTLNKKGSAYYFYKSGDQWYYSQEGTSRSIEISENHTSLVDFPSTNLPTIGRLEFDNTMTSTQFGVSMSEPVFISTNDPTGSATALNSWNISGATTGMIALNMGQLRNVDKLHIWNYHSALGSKDQGVDQYKIYGFTDTGDADLAPSMLSGVDHSADAQYTLIAEGNLAQINDAMDHEQVNSLDTSATFRWLIIETVTGHGAGVGLRKVEVYSLSQANFGFALQTEVLTKTNTIGFVPTADYHPATKKSSEAVGRNVILSSTGVHDIVDADHAQELQIDEQVNIPTLDGVNVADGFRLKIINTTNTAGILATSSITAYQRNGGTGVQLPANISIPKQSVTYLTVTDNAGKVLNIDISSASDGVSTEAFISGVVLQGGQNGILSATMDADVMRDDHITTLTTDNPNVTITVTWQRDSEQNIPSVLGSPVINITHIGATYTGTIDVLLVDGVPILVTIAGATVQTLNFVLGEKPVIVGLILTEGFPGTQTVFDGGDIMSFRCTTDVPVDTLRVVAGANSFADAIDIDVSALSSPYDINITAAEKFINLGRLTLIAIDGLGSQSDAFISTGSTQVLDNRVPSISVTSKAYIGGSPITAMTGPAGTDGTRRAQWDMLFKLCDSWEWIFGTEAIIVPNAASTSPVLRDTLFTTTHSEAGTSIIFDFYAEASINNVDTDNLTLRLHRTANDTFVDIPMNLPIQDFQITVDISFVQGSNIVRSSNTASYYEIQAIASELLANEAVDFGIADTINITLGTPTGVANTSRIRLTVGDGATRGSHNLVLMSARGASGIACNFTGADFTVKGFEVRSETVNPFSNTFTSNVEAIAGELDDLIVTWRGDPMTFSATDTPATTSFWVQQLNPVIIKLLDAAATGGSSQATTATIEEIL